MLADLTAKQFAELLTFYATQDDFEAVQRMRRDEAALEAMFKRNRLAYGNKRASN